MYTRGENQYGLPTYTTSDGTYIEVDDRDHIVVREPRRTYNSLGFKHQNASGAAQVLASMLENAYLAGRKAEETKMSEDAARLPGCSCTIDATYWPASRRRDPQCPVHVNEEV